MEETWVRSLGWEDDLEKEMKFRADEVRFVDEQESLVHHAAESYATADYVQIGSLPTDPIDPLGYSPSADEFSGNGFE